MKRRYKIGIGTILGLVIGALFGWWASSAQFSVLQPRGIIAAQQLELLIFASVLSLVVIIPVFTLLGVVAWRYREGNRKRVAYRPKWGGNNALEVVWWGIPCVLIGILSVVIWNSSHALDPYRPLESNKQPVSVQVVALQWRWLFIYPEEGIASINHLVIPKDTPVNLTVTADAPMNSFWVPSLGGQIYAMKGMSTKLHLMASEEGDFNGVSANLSGEGFSKMRFVATAKSDIGYSKWLKEAHGQLQLDWDVYESLAKPSEDVSKKIFHLSDGDLYDKIVKKYMPDHGSHGSSTKMQDMSEHGVDHSNMEGHGE